MSKRARPEALVTSQVPGRGRALAELRRSGAAGLHVKHPKVRLNTNRRAIAAELKQVHQQGHSRTPAQKGRS